MAGSPFSGKGGAASAASKKTAAAAPPAAGSKKSVDPDDLPDATNLEDDSPLSDDPYAAADPTGVSDYKPISFMGQLVLMHATETGTMKTSSNTPENPVSQYVRFDFITLTVPEPGAAKRSTATRDDDGNVIVLNKDGEVETFEAYEVGERLDDVLVFNKPLVREGRKMLDKGTAWVLGRIQLGQKKQGQSPPVILVAGDAEDKAIYAEWRKSLA